MPSEATSCRYLVHGDGCRLTEEACTGEQCDHQKIPKPVQAITCAECRHRTEPKCNKAEYAARGIAKCGNHNAPAYGRLVYLTDWCSYAGARTE